MLWFIECFGIERIIKTPFLLPDFKTFPYNDLSNTDQLGELFRQLCEVFELNPENIEIKFFDDLRDKEWTTWGPVGPYDSASSKHIRLLNENGPKFKIELAKSNLRHPHLLVSVLARELVYTILIREYLINPTSGDNEAFLDITTIFFGFSILTANSFMTNEINWINRNGFLPIEITSYANGLICYLVNKDPKEFEPFFNTNGRDLFIRSAQFLSQTEDTNIAKEQIGMCDSKYRIHSGTKEAFDGRDFETVHILNKELLLMEPNNITAFNNIGYAYLHQKEYRNAIKIFTKAIEIAPYFDYAFNNRGYGKLNYLDFEGGLSDIETALQIDNSNAYAHRNLGFYYYLNNNIEMALESYEYSMKLDDRTELIHFFYAKALESVRNIEKAKVHFELSNAKNEFNNSILE